MNNAVSGGWMPVKAAIAAEEPITFRCVECGHRFHVTGNIFLAMSTGQFHCPRCAGRLENDE